MLLLLILYTRPITVTNRVQNRKRFSQVRYMTSPPSNEEGKTKKIFGFLGIEEATATV